MSYGTSAQTPRTCRPTKAAKPRTKTTKKIPRLVSAVNTSMDAAQFRQPDVPISLIKLFIIQFYPFVIMVSRNGMRLEPRWCSQRSMHAEASTASFFLTTPTRCFFVVTQLTFSSFFVVVAASLSPTKLFSLLPSWPVLPPSPSSLRLLPPLLFSMDPPSEREVWLIPVTPMPVSRNYNCLEANAPSGPNLRSISMVACMIGWNHR